MLRKSCSFALTVLAFLAFFAVPTVSHADTDAAATTSLAGSSLLDIQLASSVYVLSVDGIITDLTFGFTGTTWSASDLGMINTISTSGVGLNGKHAEVTAWINFTNATFPNGELAYATLTLDTSHSGSTISLNILDTDQTTGIPNGTVLYDTGTPLPVVSGGIFISL